MQISKHTQLVKIRWVLAEKNAKEQSSSDIARLPVSVNPAHIIYFTFLCLNHRSFIRIFSNCRFLDQTWPCFNLHVTDPLRTVTEMSEALAEPWPTTIPHSCTWCSAYIVTSGCLVLASVRSGNKENSLNIQRCKTFCILIFYLRNLLLVNFCHSEVLSFSFQLCVNRYYLKPTVAAEAEQILCKICEWILVQTSRAVATRRPHTHPPVRA